VNAANLVDGKGFVMRAVRLNTALSIPSLAIVLGCAAALLDLPSELWKGLWTGIIVYTVVGSPVNFWLQRRTMAPMVAWLDGDRSDLPLAQRAFTAMLAFPKRMAIGAGLSWVAPTVLVSMAMEMAFPALWTAWDAAVLMVGGVAAGFSVGILTGFAVKGGVFAQVRIALAYAVGGPDARNELAPRLPIRAKLLVALTGSCLVPVLFAILIALDQGASSLESLALSWTQQVLAELPASADPAQIATSKRTSTRRRCRSRSRSCRSPRPIGSPWRSPSRSSARRPRARAATAARNARARCTRGASCPTAPCGSRRWRRRTCTHTAPRRRCCSAR
jgi:hypothetical protein